MVLHSDGAFSFFFSLNDDSRCIVSYMNVILGITTRRLPSSSQVSRGAEGNESGAVVD